MGLKERLTKFDAQGSVASEFRVYTSHGAVLSVATVLLILYLVLTEAFFNFQITRHEKVHVNATSPRGIEMEFDIHIPAVSCNHVFIDSVDPTGQSQSLHLDREHHIWKHRFRMSDDGNHRILVGSKQKLEMGSTMLLESDLEDTLEGKLMTAGNSTDVVAEEEDICGSCYGAGEEGECCSTCEDIRRVYKRRGWILRDVSEIKQCKNEATPTDEAAQEGEGCNVHGKVALSSGGGNLHIAPGKNFGEAEKGDNIFDLLFGSFQQWNVSHTINYLRFGPDCPAGAHQLDGEDRLVKDTSAMYQYYFQLVPTLYKYRNGTSIQTFQYSVTEHVRHIAPGSARGLPGIFFYYEVSPLHVEISEGYRKGWIAFFTSVCAVIGGVVTFMGILDQFMFTKRSGRSMSLSI